MSRRAPEPVYRPAIALGLAVFGLLRVKKRVRGTENIPDVGGAVLAMTHFGYFEFALVEFATWAHNRRYIRFLATKSAFDKPVVGSLLRGMHHISVDMSAGAEAYAKAVAALRAGELIGVFPEAGVDSSFTVRELKTGAARLAAEAGVPIIPVAIWGGQRLMTKGRKIKLRDRVGVPVDFAFGTPLHLAPDADVKEATVGLRSRLQELLASLQADYPEKGVGKWWYPRALGGTAPTPEEAVAAEEVRQAKKREARAAKAARG